MTWIARHRRRLQLLREAEALEAEARRLRHGLIDRLAKVCSPTLALGVYGALTIAEFYGPSPTAKSAARAMREAIAPSSGDERRAIMLQDQAKAKRGEVERL